MEEPSFESPYRPGYGVRLCAWLAYVSCAGRDLRPEPTGRESWRQSGWGCSVTTEEAEEAGECGRGPGKRERDGLGGGLEREWKWGWECAGLGKGG